MTKQELERLARYAMLDPHDSRFDSLADDVNRIIEQLAPLNALPADLDTEPEDAQESCRLRRDMTEQEPVRGAHAPGLRPDDSSGFFVPRVIE